MLLSVTTAVADNITPDVNGDGVVTTADARLIYDYILGTAAENITLVQVDVNGDGAVNTADVVEVYAEAFRTRLQAVTITPARVEIDYSQRSVALQAAVNPSSLSAYINNVWSNNRTSSSRPGKLSRRDVCFPVTADNISAVIEYRDVLHSDNKFLASGDAYTHSLRIM